MRDRDTFPIFVTVEAHLCVHLKLTIAELLVVRRLHLIGVRWSRMSFLVVKRSVDSLHSQNVRNVFLKNLDEWSLC